MSRDSGAIQYQIGHVLVGMPESSEPGKYFNWVREEWIFVFTFINGFHNFFINYLKDVDHKLSKESGNSLFETLHLSYQEKLDFYEAAIKLRSRYAAEQKSLNRMRLAIDAGFPIEAITLQECLMSNFLFCYLSAKGRSLKNASLHKLLKIINTLALLPTDKELIERVDMWRSSRNTAIHGFVIAESYKLEESQDEFMRFSVETAKQGLLLCEEICEWYGRKSVNFFPTEFPMEKKIHH